MVLYHFEVCHLNALHEAVGTQFTRVVTRTGRIALEESSQSTGCQNDRALKLIVFIRILVLYDQTFADPAFDHNFHSLMVIVDFDETSGFILSCLIDQSRHQHLSR